MRWRRQWREREPRPQVRRLSEDQKKRFLRIFNEGISSSPVLTALSIRVRTLRGRFYFERVWNEDEADIETVGRVTPLVSPATLLLEVERSKNDWFEVKRGSARKLIETIAEDTRGTFHGLGALDQSLKTEKGRGGRREVEMREDLRFLYTKTGEECTVQETLYHYFGVPIEVIAEPQVWYWYHRRPQIVEVSEDRQKVLVEFLAMSLRGSFGGRCLYTIKDKAWGAFIIRPNQSGSIPLAMSWLEKRKWRGWDA